MKKAPSSQEIIDGKLKTFLKKAKSQSYLLLGYTLTIVFGVPMVVSVCKYVAIVWELMF